MEATNLLLNRFADTYQRVAGCALGWDAVILTGGGSVLLYQRLLPILNQAKSELSESFLSSIKLAVRPGMRAND